MTKADSDLQKDTFRKFLEKVDWNRLEKLRAPQSLSQALRHLGIQHITLVRKELRTNGDRVWVHVPMWLKDDYPIVRRILSNEVGREILNQCDADMIEESYRLQESLFKTNSLGLSQAIVPIVLQGEKIGFLLMKGFVLDSQSVADVVLTERFKVLMLDAKDTPLAVKEWRALPHFSTDKRLIVVQMLELIANEVAQFLNESLSAKEREDSIHKQTFSQIVTAHPPLKNLLKRFPQMAQANTPILITGEPGTGRELVAGMLHEMSLRKNAVFKSLHCSAVAENLLEAEIFGYEKGAFIGAYTAKEGLFDQCKGGTLFLGEIADLSLALQHKILRVMHEKSYAHLGGNSAIPFDVRIIASTQRNLKRLVQMGAFREELYLLLNVMEIELPPLRQRKEDISLLAEHFLQEFMKTMRKEGIQWKADSLEKLTAHAFPGNIRELRNEVERLVALKESHSLIEIADLSAKIVESLSPIDEIEKGMTLKAIVDEYEKKIVSDALTKYHWNKSRVAELFQITRQGLLKKISKFRLDKRKRI